MQSELECVFTLLGYPVGGHIGIVLCCSGSMDLQI